MKNNNRPIGVFKTDNGYQKLINSEFYEKCPKAVFAALAVSYALNHQGIQQNEVTRELKMEWEILNENGIVPQKPPKI